MVQYAAVFMILALVAAIFGIGALATGDQAAAQVLFLAFLALFVGGLGYGLVGRRDPEWTREEDAPRGLGGEPAPWEIRHE